MKTYTALCIILSALIVQKTIATTSPLTPYTSYQFSIELEHNIADLWWTVDENRQEITFELHIKTTGWIALGISPAFRHFVLLRIIAGGMKGADIGLGWIDSTGQVHFQDRYAHDFARPVIDNTTTDWSAIKGREQNGWTAIQFKRFLDTCDSMDVPIKSGTNILIYAYDLEDPDMSQTGGMIKYHENRRGSRIIPLQSYGNPSPEKKFVDLDYFEFKLQNYVVPANDTTYHCKVYKAPTNFPQRRHAIAHKTMIDSNNRDIVHHLLMYECDPTAVFDDNNLPNGLCDDINEQIIACSSNIATGWAVGGEDIVDLPEITGYPVGGDFEIKYYMVQMHYDNPKLMPNRRDSSGIRFYLGKELRQYDLGYLSLTVFATPVAIAIPPKVDRFIIDTYCPAVVTKSFPQSGITVVGAFPHTHLQGQSVWTKIIRNKKAVEYLFNAEAYDFNYQFENILPKPIKLYPGDELATRCVYRTTNKNEISLGGEKTKNEMCMHMFMYYPRMKNFYGCSTINSLESWSKLMNSSASSFDFEVFQKWLMDLKWTPELAEQWQKFYNDAPRVVISGPTGNFTITNLTRLPDYEDLKPAECKRSITNTAIRSVFLSMFFTFTSFFVK
ncbi:unnamed protein product [Rotaria socialis]|uniref:DOMON domain-containing protein n=1 Tax=Rotaria socialis TaxID=392032 RepID=A0A821NF96_9BILA|nr:unnamed protein product [Rotaria socialis]